MPGGRTDLMAKRLFFSPKLLARMWMAGALVALAVLASSSMAFAQMCPACYQNAASQAPGMLQSLKTGVLVMLFPTLSMFILIFGVAFCRRNSFGAVMEDRNSENRGGEF